MKFTLLKVCLFVLTGVSTAFGQLTWEGGVNPEQNQPGTILFNATGTPLANSSGTLYLHTGVTLNGAPWQNVIGSWGVNAGQPALTLVSNNQYKLVISTSIQSFYNVASGSITKLNVVVRNSAGNAQTADLSLNVGAFDMNLSSPADGATVLWNPASGALPVTASNTGGAASYALWSPSGVMLDSVASASTYSYSIATPVNGKYRLSSRKAGVAILKTFSVIKAQVPETAAIPSGMRDGVNYNDVDATKATLVLNAPGKDFVYVAGNFNSWNPTDAHVMKKDPVSGKFWLDITGLTPGTWYAFQYWVCDDSPAANSPKAVKTADPFSTLVLSPFDDPEIVTLGVYPGLPVYNTIAPGQDREVSVIQTGPNAYWQYNWTSTSKPNQTVSKKDLVIYELLIRDFDSRRTYQDLIDRIDYFKNLKINAIELMPVMEFEGNMSWGYNPAFHMAPDKRYGAPAKLKEFIDLCHQNGIAVILDIALNHVFGRSPLERMWMLDTDGDGWGNGISPDNPYCNVVAKHTNNVGTDLNHFREPDNLTNTYVMRTIEEWINEYRIDGFRWDLTQGFTNSCTANDAACTGSNLPDRMAKLKWYADKQWDIDPNFYVIFEHWAFGEIPTYTNYRLSETPSKGIICWSRGDYESTDLVKGNLTGLSAWVDAATGRRQGNMESHDEERVVYRAVNESGQTSGNLDKVLARMPALGSIFFLAPGPKMIWNFAELGWNLSINTCPNGTINSNCRIDTKPQPQWAQNWLGNAARKNIYDNWAKLIELRSKADVFENGQFAFNLTTTGRPRLDVWTSTQPAAGLSYVMVHANFSNNPMTFQAFFPYTGTWYNLMDNTPITVTTTSMDITLPADGGFVVYGNAPNVYVSSSPILSAESLKFSVRNPGSDQTAFIEYEIPATSNKAVFNLYSLEGQRLMTKEVTGTSGTVSMHCPFARGLYLVEMVTTNGRKTEKLLLD